MRQRTDDDVGRFDRWSATYDRSLAQRFLFEPVHRAVCDRLVSVAPPPDTVVDVGCGTGRLLAAVRVRLPSANLVGIDPAEGMIAQARTRFARDPRVTLHVASARSMPLDDESVDAVLTTMSFHHWNDQAASIREVARVLRGDGRLIVADIFGIGAAGRVAARVLGRHGRGYRTASELDELFSPAGYAWSIRRHVFGKLVPALVIEARRER